MNLTAFFQSLAAANQVRPGAHTLQGPADAAAIQEWERHHAIALPADLVELLTTSDGVACHQEWLDGEPLFDRGAYRLYSLGELQPASVAMYGADSAEDPLTANWLSIGVGPDSAIYFAFDTDRREYLAVAPIVPDEAEFLGPRIDPILDIINPSAAQWAVR